jgi:hypothetical protein
MPNAKFKMPNAFNPNAQRKISNAQRKIYNSF